MKKALIAGAASVALAAMPVVGAFAAVDPVQVVDNLTLNINESCTFSTGSTGLNLTDTINAGAETTWASGDPAVASSHAFVINCNSKNYTVTAVATNLTKSGASAHGTITYVDNAAYETAKSSIGDDGKWTAVLTGGDTAPSTAAITTSSSTIKSGHATTSDSFSVAYKAFAGYANEQGEYTGSVTYTLTGTNS